MSDSPTAGLPTITRMVRHLPPLLLAGLAAALLPIPLGAEEPSPAEAGAAAALRSRDFAAAAEGFRTAAEAAAGRERARLEGCAEDAALALRGLDAVLRAVKEHPDRFGRVPLTKTLPATVTAADREGVTAVVQGTSSRMAWGTLDPRVLADLLERARPAGEDLLGAAALLQAAGEGEGAERMLVRHLAAGGDRVAASRALARWRGESPPEGGYVEHGGRLLSPADRDALVLEERKAAAWKDLLGDDAARRRAAFEDLRALGEPARWTLYKGLRARRALLAERLASAKSLTAPATKARLKAEVEKRRAEALALIEDPKKYPYPSEEHRGQEEVDRLVALVREAWDSPFDVVAAWDPALPPILAEAAEVDGWIAASEDPGADTPYVPDPAALKGPANAVLDVRGMFRDEYSEKVLAYNAKVRTTADAEERDNVLAVNEYRILMGRPAVKIHERLVRAARGHSKHMRLHGYFSHDSTLPGLETPGKRAARQGYAGGVGENISMGRETGRGAFDGWFHSSGHHRNMIGAGWTEMGCGRSQAHFTQLFGRATGRSLEEPDPLPPPAEDVAPEGTAGRPSGE